MIRHFFRLFAIIGSLPNNIMNGQPIDAVPVMANFNWILNQVNANAAPLAGVALLSAANTFAQVQSGPSATSLSNYPTAQQVQNSQFLSLSSVAGSTIITANAPLGMNAYAEGQIFSFIAAGTNAAGPTININGIGGRPLKVGTGPLSSSFITTGGAVVIRYDAAGSGFQVFTQVPVIPAGAVAVVGQSEVAGTDGGTAVAGFWNVRSLNVKGNDPNNIILAVGAGSCLLVSGTYSVDAWAVAGPVNGHQLRLWNALSSTTILTGGSGYNGNANTQYSPDILTGRFTIASNTLIQLHQWSQAGLVTTGLGRDSGAGANVYCQIKFTRIGN